jgi:hypothetical protein
MFSLIRLSKGRAGHPPKPKTIPDPSLIYGQVVKQREGKRVVKVEKRLLLGPMATSMKTISTSLLERQNGQVALTQSLSGA